MSIPAGPFNVVGVVVQVAPGKGDAVKAALSALPGVDLHSEAADGRLVATAIDTGDALAIDQLAAMNRIPGIVSTMLAYHQIEHPEAEAQPAPAACSCPVNTDHPCISEKGA
jgi:nitrate reductase NapD